MRIGIVSESPAMVQALRERVAAGSRHHVIWIAENSEEAVTACARTTPELVLLDLTLSGPGSVETTRRIMAGSPCAILIVTNCVSDNAERVFDAMGAGAIDTVELTSAGSPTESGVTHALVAKIELVARLIGDGDRTHRPTEQARPAAGVRPKRLVAIGASAGGPAALATILGALPTDFPAAIAIIQHVDQQFACGMAQWLGQYSTLPVRLALDGECPQPGIVHVAGTGDHLVLNAGERFTYSQEPREYIYRPSVDVFFESVRTKWHGEIVGVLLTGMGRDGAKGLRALRDDGHHTIAQDEASSALYGMPKAAAALNAAAEILSVDKVAGRLVDVVTFGLSRAALRRLG